MLEDSDTDAASIQRIFDGQLATALALRESTAPQRARKLERLRDALFARRDALVAAFRQDLRKHPVEVDLTELLPVVDEIRHALARLSRWMRPQRVAPTLTTLGTSARVLHQPRGRCLVIGPWNYPVNTLLGPLVSAVAAGNAVILKPSELAPHVNAVVAELVGAVFDATEVATVRGGVATAQHLLALPFDHVFFTGSPAVGKIVMVELGGKSPVIVDATADLRHSADLVVWGKLANAGQTCVAPDHVYVHDSVKDAFIDLCAKVIAERFGATAAAVAASPDLGRMINTRHAARVGALVDDAVARGARLAAGGHHDAQARYVAPTLLADVPDSAAIASEEIFGPVLPIRGFESLDEVIARINAGPKPLALYLWSKDSRSIARVKARTSSGGFCLNHCVQQYAHSGLPFGGVNGSGIGNSHGVYGFRAFSHERAFLASGPLMALKLFFPPYSRRTARLSGGLLALLRWV
jgi:aldehyde dehydrogenase (NAD+)